MSLKSDVVRGLKWTAGARLGGQLVTWVITIYVMRLLVPADYGLVAMSSVAIALLAMFAEAGLGPALVNAAEVSEERLRQAFGLIILINLGFFLFLLAIAPVIAGFYSEPRVTDVLRVLALTFLILPFNMLPEVALQRRLDYKVRSLVELSTAMFASVLTLTLAYMHCGVWSLIFGTVGATAMRALLLNIAAPPKLMPVFKTEGMRDLLFYGGRVTTARMLWFVYSQADIVIIGRFQGVHDLAIYSVAMHLASLPVQRISVILNQVAFPAISRYQHDKAVIVQQLRNAFNMLALVAFPVLWGMCCTAPDLVAVVLGDAWTESVLPLQILTLVMPFRMLVNFLPTVMDAIGRPDVSLHNMVVSVIVMPVAFLIGSHWGIVGVSMSWLIVFPMVLYYNVYRMMGVLDVTVAYTMRGIMPAIASGLGMMAGVEAVRWLLRGRVSNMQLLVLEVASGALVYFALTLLLNKPAVALLRKKKTAE